MTAFTTNLHLELVNFNVVTWHDQTNDNWKIIDAAITALGVTGLVGVWQNLTMYTVGQRVVDDESFTIWQVAVQHTSAAAPTTFLADRTANPTFWTQVITYTFDYLPTVDDVTDLGAAVHRFNRLFLKSGGRVDFGNGNYTIIHSPGTLAFNGLITAPTVTAVTANVTGLATLEDAVVTDDLAIGGDLDVNGAVTLKGTTAGTDAAAGDIGEVISSEIIGGGAVTLVSATPKTITSIVLSAGDWDLYGSVSLSTAATTSITRLAESLAGATNSTDQSPNRYWFHQTAALVPGVVTWGMPAMAHRVSIAAPTTFYLTTDCTFSVAALVAFGKIWARRAR